MTLFILPDKIPMTFSQLDFVDLFDDETDLTDSDPGPSIRTRGRPPLTVKNPLDHVPESAYLDEDGSPLIWLDDILTGSIRSVGERDQRATTKSPYVGLMKVVRVLNALPGDLTPKRVSAALGVSYDIGWRIVSVIGFAALHIERALKSHARTIKYTPPTYENYDPRPTRQNLYQM